MKRSAALLLSSCLVFSCSGGGSGGVPKGDSGDNEVWTGVITANGTGTQAYCDTGNFNEDYTFTLSVDGSLSKVVENALISGSSKTVYGEGEISGEETVNLQSLFPEVCLLEETFLVDEPVTIEAYNSNSELIIFLRSETLILGGKAWMPGLGYNQNLPGDVLKLEGLEMDSKTQISGSWSSIASDNYSTGTFTMNLEQ